MKSYVACMGSKIRTLYREEFGWHLSPLAIRYAAGQHTAKTTELLITNYPIEEREK